MKIIPKFQKGSSFEQFYTAYQPIEFGSGSAKQTKESKKSSDDGDLTEKDLFSMLKDMDGLPNEMEAIASDLTAMMRYGNLSGISSSALLTRYILSLYKIKHAKFNKDQYDLAYNRSKENGSLNDIAINLNGTVVVLNEDGEMITVTPEEYVKKRNKYTPVTNSNLLWLRAHNPSYINNNQVFQVVENGIGLSSINQMIKDRIQTMGTSEQTADRYVSRDAMAGSQMLMAAMQQGPDGIYKLTEKAQGTTEELINAALYYAYSMLPQNAKTRLKIQTSTGSDNEVLNVIKSLIISGTSESHDMLINYDQAASKAASGAEGGLKTSAANEWYLGHGDTQTILLNPGSRDGIYAYGNMMSLTDKEGHAITDKMFASSIRGTEWASMLDLSHASIAGEVIPERLLSNMLLEDNQVYSIDYPTVLNDKGVAVPRLDADVLKEKDAADKEIKDKLGVNIYDQQQVAQHYKEVNEIYNAHGLGEPYDSEGNPTNGWKRFAVLRTYVTTAGLEKDPLFRSPLLNEITGPTRDLLIKDFDDSPKFDKGFLGTGWRLFRQADRILEGTIWIPVVEHPVNALGGNLRDYKTNEISQLGIANQQDNARNNLNIQKNEGNR